MGIFRALGFIILLLALRFLLPEVFHAGEKLIIDMINFTGDTLATVSHALPR